MTIRSGSLLPDGQVITSFDPKTDSLSFDDSAISAVESSPSLRPFLYPFLTLASFRVAATPNCLLATALPTDNSTTGLTRE